MKSSLFIVLISILFTISAYCQGEGNYTNIRQVDFLNFTYNLKMTADREWAKEVKTINGKFEENTPEKHGNFYFNVKVFYTDINSDSAEEAIIIASFGRIGSNWENTGIIAYTLKDGKPFMLASLDQGQLQKDYAKLYPNSSLWPVSEAYLATRMPAIFMEVSADGYHAGPEYEVFMQYTLKGNEFILSRKPIRFKNKR